MTNSTNSHVLIARCIDYAVDAGLPQENIKGLLDVIRLKMSNASFIEELSNALKADDVNINVILNILSDFEDNDADDDVTEDNKIYTIDCMSYDSKLNVIDVEGFKADNIYPEERPEEMVLSTPTRGVFIIVEGEQQGNIVGTLKTEDIVALEVFMDEYEDEIEWLRSTANIKEKFLDDDYMDIDDDIEGPYDAQEFRGTQMSHGAQPMNVNGMVAMGMTRSMHPQHGAVDDFDDMSDPFGYAPSAPSPYGGPIPSHAMPSHHVPIDDYDDVDGPYGHAPSAPSPYGGPIPSHAMPSHHVPMDDDELPSHMPSPFAPSPYVDSRGIEDDIDGSEKGYTEDSTQIDQKVDLEFLMSNDSKLHRDIRGLHYFPHTKLLMLDANQPIENNNTEDLLIETGIDDLYIDRNGSFFRYGLGEFNDAGVETADDLNEIHDFIRNNAVVKMILEGVDIETL